jgi:RNA polymerase sigma factor (TIGR02999 family)
MQPSPDDLTRLLHAYGSGDRAALERLMPSVYNELRRLAAHYLRRERAGHTLQPTALVNEAYLRLVDQRNADWKNRAHFFAIAGQAMRRVLLDHAKARRRDKRGGAMARVTLDEGLLASPRHDLDIEALEEALGALAAIDARQVTIVELRYFGGLSVEETAEALGISPATVRRDWTVAKAWLRRALREGPTA